PFQLSQNSPNPFRASTRITYRLDEAGMVSLALYDVMGRSVRTLVNGLQASGVHDLTLDGEGLPAGIYWYRLTAAGRTETRQAIRVR
ncbi:MAG: hypothetical protein FD129_1195, partial [bacterium]